MSAATILSVLVGVLSVLCRMACVEGFVHRPLLSTPRHVSWHVTTRTTTTSAAVSSADTTTTAATAALLEAAIDAALQAGEKNPVPLIEQLEAMEIQNGEPNRSPAFLGEWHVWWTDCPPPSNGQLGPFTGTSEQMIADRGTASYQNLLRVPPNDWLMAVLDGVYEDWDGTLLTGAENEEYDNQQQQQPGTATVSTFDWGARHWKVTFLKLTISVFGLPLIQKEFPPGTARVWRTTYMQDNVRIVRAGKTGRTSDEVIFYTKRQPKPL